MIDCPVCHIKNQDQARFCAGCGQNLSTQPSTIEPSLTNQQPLSKMESEQQIKVKLRSPLLQGNLQEDSDEAVNLSLENNLPHLSQAKSKLNSPLLGSGNKLGTSEQSYFSVNRSGLHSPLLGSSEPQITHNITPERSVSNLQHFSLHSPFLGNPGLLEENETNFEEDLNVLRSPLLAAKVPLSEISSPSPSLSPSNLSSPSAPPSDPIPSIPKISNQPVSVPSEEPRSEVAIAPSKHTKIVGTASTSKLQPQPKLKSLEKSTTPNYLRFLLWPLLAAALLKLWYIGICFRKAGFPFILDQTAQLLAIGCLILACATIRAARD